MCAAIVPSPSRDGRSRSRQEVDAQRRKIYSEASTAADRLAAEAHAKLPRRVAKSIGAIYVRYSTEFQDSAEDQIRALFEFAVANGIYVPREYVYFDLGVRGYTSSRDSLNQLRGTLAAKKVEVLLLFATNRLFRKVYLTLQFVEQVVKEWGIRCVFVKSNIDTAKNDHSQHLLHFHAMLDEFQVSVNAEHVRAALEGLFLEGLVFGTITFGYAGEEIAGKKTKRGLPRRRLVIDARESEIVRLIFHLFVHERLSIRNIARRLNSIPDVPLPHKARHLWTPNSVRQVLKRPAYRGHFVFSVTEKCFIASKDYTRQIPRDLPLAEKDFEYLRIVDDVNWYAAQERLAQNTSVAGRPTKDGTPAPTRVLAGLFRCPEHDRALRSGLAFGKYMYCPECDLLEADKRTLYSKLNRKLALELLCNKLQELILQDSELVGKIIAACQMAAAEIQQPDTSEAEVLKRKLLELTRVIDFNRRNPGQTDEDQQQQQCLIGELERERSGVRAKIARLEATAKLPIRVPSLEEAQQLVADLSQVFQNAAAGNLGDEQERFREIFWSLTGGQIDLFQMGPAEPMKGWLQGRFQVHLLRTLVATACGSSENIPDVPLDVVIDLKRPRKTDSDADTAIQLWLDGYLNQEIAEKLYVGASYISRILRLGAERIGTTLETLQYQRKTRQREPLQIPKYQQIADDAQKLWWEELYSLAEVARRLTCSTTTIDGALKYWYEKHDLPLPTFEEWSNRRETRILEFDADRSLRIEDVADRVHLAVNTVRRMITAANKRLGRPKIDRRRKEFRRACEKSADQSPS